MARFTERASDGRNPGWMYARWRRMVRTDKRDPNDWPPDFLEQTGENVDYAANAIGALLDALR